jgi:hypothetical protein
MGKKEEQLKEVAVYTAERPEIAQMLVEKLENLSIPARIGSESAAAGVFAVPESGKVIWVPEKFAGRAKEILGSGESK